MSEFKPFSVSEMDLIVDDECVAGYLSGLHGNPEPGSDKSRSFFHGWRNGMIDSNRMILEPDDYAFATAYVNRLKDTK